MTLKKIDYKDIKENEPVLATWELDGVNYSIQIVRKNGEFKAWDWDDGFYSRKMSFNDLDSVYFYEFKKDNNFRYFIITAKAFNNKKEIYTNFGYFTRNEFPMKTFLQKIILQDMPLSIKLDDVIIQNIKEISRQDYIDYCNITDEELTLDEENIQEPN